MTTGVVAALGAEARTLRITRRGLRSTRRGDGLLTVGGMLVAVSGMGWTAAETAARALTQAGATALVSWGMAGGLDPALSAGTICVPAAVMRRDGPNFATDRRWREFAIAAIGGRCRVVSGQLLTSSHAIDDVAAKAAAFSQTGAAVVDMESGAVAHIAAVLGLPFIAVRAIVDTAGDALPGAVLAATTPTGVRLSCLSLGVLRSPRDLAPLLRLATRYRAATRALAAAAATGALMPLFSIAASPTRLA